MGRFSFFKRSRKGSPRLSSAGPATAQPVAGLRPSPNISLTSLPTGPNPAANTSRPAVRVPSTIGSSGPNLQPPGPSVDLGPVLLNAHSASLPTSQKPSQSPTSGPLSPAVTGAPPANSPVAVPGVSPPALLPRELVASEKPATSNDCAVRALWEQALDRLSTEDRACIDSNTDQQSELDMLSGFIRATEESKKKCEERRFKYKNSQGQEVPVRDFVDSLLSNLNKITPMVDLFVQPLPAVVSLAWGGFKFLLQVATSDMENTRIAMESLNGLSRVMSHCSIYERLYSDNDLEAATSLGASLKKLYVSVLEYLCYLKRHLDHNTAVQGFKNILSGLQSRWAGVLELEVAVEKEAAVAHLDAGDKKMREILAFLEEMKGFQEPIIRQIERTVADIFESIQGAERGKVLQWLSEIPVRAHHDFTKSTRHLETGDWLFDEPCFRGWDSSDSSSLLWLHGIPGSGKTNLASKIIDEVKPQDRCALAYFYCNYQEEKRKKVSEILRALVKQLCLAAPGGCFPEPVLSLYRKRKNDGELSNPISVRESKELLMGLSTGFLRTTIVIDALDECDENTRGTLIDVLGYLVSLPELHLVKIFVTSRDKDDLNKKLQDFPDIYILESHNSRDLGIYIESEVEACIKAGKLSPASTEDRKQHVIQRLKDKASGMFIWTKHQITKICDEVTWDGIEESLERPSKDMKAMYTEILDKIKNGHQSSKRTELAEHALKWILHAVTPPTPHVLIEALSVKITPEPTTASPPDHNYLSLAEVLAICENFVVHDKKLDVLRFAHFSVQEFLQNHYDSEECHRRAAEVCLTVLTYHHAPDSQLSDGLLHYSCYSWWNHVRLSGDASNTLKELCKVFLRLSPAYNTWLKRVQHDYQLLPQHPSKFVAPLIVASYFQLSIVFGDLLDVETEPNSKNRQGQTALHIVAMDGNEVIARVLLNAARVDVDSKDNSDRTPLSWASEMGHKEIVQMLLDLEVDVDSKDNYGQTPLSWASEKGHKEIVRMLLDREVDVDSKDNSNRTPLSWASEMGQKEIVQMLLDRAVDVDSKDKHFGRTPLSWASEKGHKEIVQMLLDRAVDVDSKDKHFGRTPLLWASEQGHKEIVQMLLDREVDVDSKDKYFNRTPLSWASEKGHKGIVQMLLDREVDVDSKDNSGQTPLSLASEKGHKEIVQMLLDREVDVDSKDNSGQTPLSWASEKGHKEIVQMLLDLEVDVDSKDNYGQTPLSWASEQGHKEIVQMLLDREVDVDSKDNSGRTPLSWASEKGHKEIVRMLLDREVDVDSKDNSDRTPLSWASEKGHKEIVQMLLDREVDVDSKDNSDRTPLSWASEQGHKEIVQMLLDREVDVDSKDNYGQTPLSWASEQGHKEIVQMLLDREVDVDSKDNFGQTPLSWASEMGHKEIVQMLLDREVDVDSRDNSDRTPLSWASEIGHKEIVQMLLDGEVDVNGKDDSGRTPLSLASEKGHKEIVQMLLDREVDVDSKDNSDRTPLSWASEKGHKEIVQMLLDLEVDVDSKNKYSGRTPLSWASEKGHKEIVRMLLDREVDVDSKDNSDRTPLSWASEKGHKEIVQMLLDREVDVDSKNKYSGRTPLSWASEKGHKEIVRMLLDREVDVNSKDDSGRTPPLWALEKGHMEIVQMLLDREVDVNSKDNSDRTPLSLASEMGHKKIMQILLSRKVDVDSKHDSSLTSITRASDNGHMETV